MRSDKRPNRAAFFEQLRLIGPEMFSGVPSDLVEHLEHLIKHDALLRYEDPHEILCMFWRNRSPEEAVKKALESYLQNLRDAVWGDTLIDMHYKGDDKKIDTIIARFKIRDDPQIIARLVAAAMTPEGDIPVERLSFELLPPGDWDMDDVIEHFKREKERLPDVLRKRAIQEHRLMMIKSLAPEKCYVGNKQWLGYVVFEFSNTDKVVLECPIEGNATYVLTGNWESMIQHTRQFLRQNYPDKYVKIVHRGDWFERVRQALF